MITFQVLLDSVKLTVHTRQFTLAHWTEIKTQKDSPVSLAMRNADFGMRFATDLTFLQVQTSGWKSVSTQWALLLGAPTMHP